MKMGCLEAFDFPAPLTCHHSFLFFYFIFFKFQLGSFCCFAHVNISLAPASSQLSLLPLLGSFPRLCLVPGSHIQPQRSPRSRPRSAAVTPLSVPIPAPLGASEAGLPALLPLSTGTVTPRSLLAQISNPRPRAAGQRRISMRTAVWCG